MKRPAHHPACDTELGPEFKVEPGVVLMTIHVCLGECWDEFDTRPTTPGAPPIGSEKVAKA